MSSGLFIDTLFSDSQYFFMWVIIVVFSICVHEYAHARTALYFNDDTAARLGHLTLNPLVQMGPISIVMLLIIGIAWGSVPINPANYRKRIHRVYVSLAGPISNLILSIIFAFISVIAGLLTQNHNALLFFQIASLINSLLFVFNMLPLPGFDGWTVLCYFWRRGEILLMQYGNIFAIGLLVLIFFTNVFSFIHILASYISGFFTHIFILIAGLFM